MVLASIFLFVFLYSNLCFFIYQNNYAGYVFFDCLSDSFYNIVILLTTANFPDIMLPTYNENYWSCLPFIGFLIVGLYFLMSILLANVYMKFKQRVQKQCEEQLQKQ